LRFWWIWLAAALVAAPLVAAAQPADAPKRDLRIMLDPDNPAVFGIGGWDRQIAQTGTIYYQCREEACEPGSLVSVRRQSPTADPPSAETLRREAVERGETIMQRSQGQIVRIETGTPKASGDKLLRRGEVTQTFVLAPGGSGDIPQFWKNGYIVNKTAAFTVTSSGRDRQKVDTNYAVFNLALALVLQRLAGEAKPAE
jgi:hypothetical protein